MPSKSNITQLLYHFVSKYDVKFSGKNGKKYEFFRIKSLYPALTGSKTPTSRMEVSLYLKLI